MTGWTKRKALLGGLCFVLTIASGAGAFVASMRGTATTQPAAQMRHQMPQSLRGFVSNPGMFNARVAYWTRNPLGDTYVLDDGRLLHALPAGTVKEGGATKRRVWVIVERAAAPGRTASGMSELDSKTSYIGSDRKKSSPLRSFKDLAIAQAWPGIDLAIRHTDEGIERVFTVQPGARADRIEVSLDGAKDARLASNGDLQLTTGVGTVTYTRPSAYQVGNGGVQIAVPVAYRVLPGQSSFGVSVGAYDKSKPLIIDPVLQGTFLGDEFNQTIYAMAIDPANGDVLVAGSWSFGAPPAIAGGFQTVSQVGEMFITRSDAKLERVIHSTILGGASAEDAMALAINPRNGDVFVGGDTLSPDFPGGGGSDEPVLPPGTLGASFVSRLSGDLHRLEQTTYFSAMLGSERVWDIAVNPSSGDVYVVGYDLGGAVVTRYDEHLNHILARQAIQGNVSDRAKGVAVNPVNGDVYVVGTTASWKFPKIAGGAFSATTHPVGGDFGRVFVARFDAALSTHVQSTFLWDGEGTEGQAPRIPVIVDPASGDVIVSTSAFGDFGPITGGAQSSYAGGSTDALVVRFSGDLARVNGATYFGGVGDEWVAGIGISPDGQSIFIGGMSDSRVLPGIARTGGAGFNAMLARLSADLSVIHSSIIYDSPHRTNGWALQVSPFNGEPYLAGISADVLVGTHGGFQPELAVQGALGGYDSFIARFDPQLSTSDSVTPDAFAFPTQIGVAPGSVATSPAIRVYGYTAPVPIHVSNGSYSLDGGAFTSSDGTLQPGQKVQLQHVAASLAGGNTRTSLSIGNVVGTFDSVVQTGVTVTPLAFNFVGNNSAVPGVRAESNAIVVQGTDAPAPISVSGGDYSIDGGAFTTDPGIVNSGQSVVVGHTTATAANSQVDTVLTIGGRSGTFTTVTEPLTVAPHAFAFPGFAPPRQTPTPDTDYDSYPATIIGINGPSPISVSGGQYSINAGPWTSNAGTVNNFDLIQARLHTGASGSTTTATVTVGGVSGSFSVEVPGPVPAAQIPKAFSFKPANGVEPHQWVELDPVSLTGFTEAAMVNFGPPGGGLDLVDAQWFNPALQEYVPIPGRLPPGQPLRIRLFINGYDTKLGVAVSVGGTTAVATITTMAQGASTTPTAFQFQDHLDVAPGSVLTTESIELRGLGAPSTVSVSGCQVSISGGAFVTGGTVLNGDTLTLKITAPSGAGQSATCTVSVGTFSESLSISTSGGGGSGPPAASGGGGGALDGLGIALLTLLWGLRRRLPATS
jgi:hypothetical protein